MQADKLLPAGEGGVLIIDNLEYYERAVTFGHYERVLKLPSGNYNKYSATGMGFKFRMHPIAAAIAQANLDNLPSKSDLINKNAIYLEECLKDIQGFDMQKVYQDAQRQYSYHFVKYNEKQFKGLSLTTFLKALEDEGG